MSFAQTLALNRELRSLSPDEIVEDYSQQTRDVLARTADSYIAEPVVICAHNEEDDIGATLVSLAMSGADVRPIVVDNGSTDGTAAIAEAMGATVLSEPEPSKMRAYKSALRFLGADILGDTVLFTDADTIVGPDWAERMSGVAANLDEGNGGIVFGLVMFSHSKSGLTNVVRNVSHTFAQFRNLASKGIRPPIARGANCSISFDADGAIFERLMGMRPDVFPQDFAVMETIVDAGGLAKADVHPDSTAMSRGDRYDSLRDYILARRGHSNYRQLYAREYGEDHPAYSQEKDS